MNKVQVGYMKPSFDLIFILLAVGVFFMMQGCTQSHSLYSPHNPTNKFYGNTNENGDAVNHLKEPKVFATHIDCQGAQNSFAPVNFRVDRPLPFDPHTTAPHPQDNSILNRYMPLSPGDLVEIIIEDGEGFSGKYVIDSAGYLSIPLLTPIRAQGLGLKQLSNKIELALVRAQIFRPDTITINTQVLELAEIEVSVSGAVFSPGRTSINSKSRGQVIDERMNAYGDHSSNRLLSEALRAASGIRPDAKLDQVLVIRNGWQFEVDMSGILTGNLVKDISLVANDQVIVPSTGCFQPHLVRPSQITPKGFRIFISNLTDSAFDNASAAVGRYSSNIPYGTRLLQAAVTANCVGGKQWTNAPRKIVLASKNPLTGQFQVVERSVELIMRQAHIDDINPYLMPNDAVACYDSDVTNLRDVARGIVEIITPFKYL